LNCGRWGTVVVGAGMWDLLYANDEVAFRRELGNLLRVIREESAKDRNTAPRLLVRSGMPMGHASAQWQGSMDRRAGTFNTAVRSQWNRIQREVAAAHGAVYVDVFEVMRSYPNHTATWYQRGRNSMHAFSDHFQFPHHEVTLSTRGRDDAHHGVVQRVRHAICPLASAGGSEEMRSARSEASKGMNVKASEASGDASTDPSC